LAPEHRLSRSLWLRWLFPALLALLTGCGGGAVIFAPTPLPPDISPMRYQHPGGAFGLVVPRTWAVYEQNTTTLATAAFSPPGSDHPALTVAVINLGRSLDTAEFGDLLNRYQTHIRPDLARYSEQSRQAMGDGSWRMAGLRALAGGDWQQVNTFIEQTGGFIGVIEAVIPADADLLAELQGVINTFEINTEAELQSAELPVLVAASSVPLDVVRVATWTTPAGVFYITGEIVNYGGAPVVGLPVRAVLYSEEGLPVADAQDVPMGYGILPGEFAPFSLRFGQGQPAIARTYTLTLGDGDWQPPPAGVIHGGDVLRWEDESAFNEQGELVISGTVTNTGGQTVRSPRAVVTVFGPDQTVIAARFADLTVTALQPGTAAPFEIIVPELGDQPEEYIVTIQGVP
jgi:hypothetical protein